MAGASKLTFEQTFAKCAIPQGVLAALGVLCSVVGTFFVKTKEGASQRNLLRALRTGTYISAALFVVCAFVAIRLLLPQNMGVFVAVLSGLVAGVAIGAITEYYTSDTYKPTQRLAASSETGSACPASCSM